MTPLDHGSILRPAAYLAVLGVMLVWEWVAPRRRLSQLRRRRWPTNLSITLLDALVVRALFPLVGVELVLALRGDGWGLFPWLGLPGWIEATSALLLLDLSIYLQHLALHKLPWLWRLHAVHHADPDLDATSGTRFHPVEVALSMLYRLSLLALLAPPPVIVLTFELLLNALAVFNHGNVRMATRLDALLRRGIVTPDMHRVHHSVIPEEYDSNFGFNLPVWDRLFGTYRAQPAAGHTQMRVGLAGTPPREAMSLTGALGFPFRPSRR